MTLTVKHDPLHKPYTGLINLDRPHFVGIGAAGMSEVAHLCAAWGATVSGSVTSSSPQVDALRAAGCHIDVGYDPTRIQTATCVVYSAVTADSSEVVAARGAGIPVVHTAQVLDAIANGRRLVGVAGTHGKSTTASMLAAALTDLGANPSYAIGADLDKPGSGARYTASDVMVAEADESDRGFHFLNPETVIITGISHDHPENYTDLADHVEAYSGLIDHIPHGGHLIANGDDPATRELANRVHKTNPHLNVATYGETAKATARICTMRRFGWSTEVTVRLNGQELTFTVPSPSSWHAYDAVAALVALKVLGFAPSDAANALGKFPGVKRRFTLAGEAAGVSVVESYAHHPAQITADLAAAGALADSNRVLVVFQPTGYSRVAAFGRDIAHALAEGADEIILLDIHGGRPINGVSSTIVADAITAAGSFAHMPALGGVPALVSILADVGDVVVTMGTGDVTNLTGAILDRLRGGPARKT